MDFCYVWLKRIVGSETEAFSAESTRNADELTGNITLKRGIERFTKGLSAVFCKMAAALKPGSPLAFTFHHNSLEAYQSVAVALLDARLTCSVTFPAPAEMGGSIHISGTGSSIIDTIFVCRSTGKIARRTLANDSSSLSQLVRTDLEQLRIGGVKPTRGDCRCIAAGHLTRLAVWNLKDHWQSEETVSNRLQAVNEWMKAFGGLEPVLKHVGDCNDLGPITATATVREEALNDRENGDHISF